MSDSIRRQLLIDKLSAAWPRAATNSARPKPSDNRSIPELARSITGKIEELRSVLAEAKRSTAPPVAIARRVETAARQTANQLSAVRRAAAPAPRAVSKPAGEMTRSERREAARSAATFTAANAENFSDGFLVVLANHDSTGPADRELAVGELKRRGVTLHPNGSTSRSIRK